MLFIGGQFNSSGKVIQTNAPNTWKRFSGLGSVTTSKNCEFCDGLNGKFTFERFFEKFLCCDDCRAKIGNLYPGLVFTEEKFVTMDPVYYTD